eukprot:365376-Chlamydomonas_euryale.AAC.5
MGCRLQLSQDVPMITQNDAARAPQAAQCGTHRREWQAMLIPGGFGHVAFLRSHGCGLRAGPLSACPHLCALNQVFEYLSTDLKKWMDRGGKGPAYPLPLGTVKNLMYQLVKGLAYCHKHGILHRWVRCAAALASS